MIRFENVTFGYSEKRPILDDLTFHIEKGDFVALICANGAGKSTISRLTNGLLHPTKGHVYLNGKDTLKTPSSTLARDCGFLFQNPDRQICENTVKDEIAFSMKAQGWPSDEIEKRVEKVIKTFDLDPEWFPFSRSRGERQRIALASVLVCEPGLLILDEPTGELDPESSREIFRILTRLNQEKGITVVIVEQKIMLLCEYVKHMMVLDKGHIAFYGTPRDMVSSIETFKELGINVPRVTELSAGLIREKIYDGEVTLTVDDAEKMVRRILG